MYSEDRLDRKGKIHHENNNHKNPDMLYDGLNRLELKEIFN